MVRFRMIDNRTKVAKKIKELQDKIDTVQDNFLRRTAAVIVLNSPVDTGTYMDAHNIGVAGSVVSSKGKPRQQPWQPHADRAMDRLNSQITALPEGSIVYIANNAEHAPLVEYDLGHAPYTIARGQAQRILDAAVADSLGRK